MNFSHAPTTPGCEASMKISNYCANYDEVSRGGNSDTEGSLSSVTPYISHRPMSCTIVPSVPCSLSPSLLLPAQVPSGPLLATSLVHLHLLLQCLPTFFLSSLPFCVILLLPFSPASFPKLPLLSPTPGKCPYCLRSSSVLQAQQRPRPGHAQVQSHNTTGLGPPWVCRVASCWLFSLQPSPEGCCKGQAQERPREEKI